MAQKTLAGVRRRSGVDRRRPAAGPAHPGQSARARRLWPRDRRHPHRHHQPEHRPAQGQFRRPGAELDDQRQRPAADAPTTIERLVVAYKNGDAVRLSDVATVVEGPENTELAAWANRTPAIILNIQRQPGTERHRRGRRGEGAAAEAASRRCRPAWTSPCCPTRPTTIRASVADVEFELGLAVVLVVLVIFVFLRNLPATIIPSLSVPLSLVGTLAGMYLFGFSLDNLSLMSLTIATGFVVDDAIVMIENIARYIERGEAPLAGGAEGRRRDRLHHHLADRLADRGADSAAVHAATWSGGCSTNSRSRWRSTIVLSAVVSLTLVPMMCALMLRHARGVARSRFAAGRARLRVDHRGYDRGARLGARPPGADARRRGSARWLLTCVQYVEIPKGFFPDAGHRRDPGHHQRAAGHLVRGDGRSGSRRWPTRSSRTRTSSACRRSSASTGPT